MKHLYLVIVIVFTSLLSNAQNATLTGTVRDEETSEPLGGATIKYEKGRGNITDASGKYQLSLPAGDYEIAVTFIGYKTYKEKVTLTAGEKKTLNIQLKSSAIQVSQVVTVSAYRKNVAKETVTTEVVSKNQIKNTNSNDLGEAVSKTPGVLVQDGQISIRGGSSYSYGVGTRTAVLSDGLNLTSADLGEGQSKMVPLSNVKQVEVTKGASSVIYGSSALNGVVNVVTEWPTDSDPKTEVELNFGFFNAPPKGVVRWWGDNLPPAFGIINFNHQRRIKNLQLVASANITKNEGYLQTSGELRQQVLLKTRYLHPKIEGLNFGVNGSFQYETSDRFFISRNLDSLALFVATGSDDQYYRASVDPFVSYTNSKGHRFNGNYRYMHIFRPGGTIANAVSNQIIADNQYQYRWKNMLVVTAGIPFSVGVSSSNLYPGTRINYAVSAYTQVEFNYKFLSLQGGLRYEIAAVDTAITIGFPIKAGSRQSTPVGLPVFRSGINIQAAKATFFRASWGQGYRIPSIGEKFVAQEFIGGLMIVPNDTLSAETGWSLELGFKQGFKIGKWSAYVDAAFYWQEYKNFIEFQIGSWDNRYSNGAPIFPDSLEFPFAGTGKLLGLRAFNVENARIAGYEAGIAGTGSIGPVGINILAGYTYTWPGKNERDTSGNLNYSTGEFIRDMFRYNFRRLELTDPDTSKLLYYRIRHLFRADIELSYWKFYVGATLNYGSIPEKIPALFKAASVVIFGNLNELDEYVRARPNGDFFMDMRMGMNINDHFKIGFIVKNVTNRLYMLRPGKPEPLRNYTLQLRYTF